MVKDSIDSPQLLINPRREANGNNDVEDGISDEVKQKEVNECFRTLKEESFEP